MQNNQPKASKATRLAAVSITVLFLAVGFGQSASATTSAGVVIPGVRVTDQGMCSTYDNSGVYREECAFKVSDGEVCIGYYYEHKKKTGEKTESCDHAIDPRLGGSMTTASPKLGDVGSVGVMVEPGVCSYTRTNKYYSERCALAYGDGYICYNYYHYERYSDGYEVTSCDYEVEYNALT